MAYARGFIKRNLEYADIGTNTDDFVEYWDEETQTEEIQFNEFVSINPQQAAFACLVDGIGFSQFQRLLLFINIDPPPRNQFFDAQDALCKAILEYARNNCSIYLQQIDDGEAVCFEAFWAAHLRKFIDFDTVSLLSNPDLTSNSLESQILRTLAERHKDDTRFKYFVHDKDTKAFKLIREEIGWNLEERLDFTHTTKSWKEMFEKKKMLAINGNKNRTNVLDPLEDSLLRWFHVSLKLDSTFEQRKTNYLQAFSHSLLNQNWKNRNHDSAINNEEPNEEEKNRITVELVLGMRYIHKFKIMHRDLKPLNILLSKNKHVRITDFGLAKEEELSTSQSKGVGTLRFMAPELFEEDNEDYNNKVDVYSFGIILIFIITNEYSGEFNMVTVFKVVTFFLKKKNFKNIKTIFFQHETKFIYIKIYQHNLHQLYNINQ